MNGAESLMRTLVASGVDVCFANPGTSEMHLVQAIDRIPQMRAVLCLFEGVCSGAADGYGRMAGKPAATLLHLGPGFGNSIANLHNARRAATPIVNLVGNHPHDHLQYDVPLTSDIDTLAKNVSNWIHGSATAVSLAGVAAEACAAARTPSSGSAGQIATLIIPADASWGESEGPALAIDPPGLNPVPNERVEAVARTIDTATVILLDGPGLSERSVVAASRIARASGCRIMVSTFPSRLEGGPDMPSVSRLPYFPEQVLAALDGVQTLVLAGAAPPASFFAYPETPRSLVPAGCRVERLGDRNDDVEGALEALAASFHAERGEYDRNGKVVPAAPSGRLSARAIAASLANLLPEGSILCADSGGGGAAFGPLQSAVRHTWLNLTGGSIGLALPAALGAAIACPGRCVVALAGDGAAMYTNQALWTQAREGANVINVIFSNGRYGILDTEYRRLGVNEIGDGAERLFSLSNPDLDFVAIAKGMGVPGVAATSAEEFTDALAKGLSASGPFVIDAKM